ncbi:MAG TPA: DUF4337 domain-containing protein [Abditibacteriaceae bacterium]|jgi:hypothetical protein
MKASEVAEQIVEHGESEQEDKLRKLAALWIGILALLLAISGLGGGNAAEDMVDYNVRANDTWAFYQAKNIRQTANELAADQLETQLLIHEKTLSAPARRAIAAKIAGYKATAARYDDEPDAKAPNDLLKGEGKKQLKAQAAFYETQRERAGEQDSNFDFADVLLQIAVVVGSVAILASSRSMLTLSFVSGTLGALLAFNGYTLLVALPW